MATNSVALAVVGVVAAVAASVPAADEPVVSVDSAVAIDGRTGLSADRSRGVRLEATADLSVNPSGAELPVVTGRSLLLARGLVFNGADYPSCRRAVLERAGPRGCPRRSILGTSGDDGRADVLPPDGSTRPYVTYVNGGKRRIWAFTTVYHPTLVQVVVPIELDRRARGPWGYRMRMRTPEALRVIAGAPVRISRFAMRIGGRRFGRRYVELERPCPKRGFLRYELTTELEYSPERSGAVTSSGRIACREKRSVPSSTGVPRSSAMSRL